MFENFKESLKMANNLNWLILSISFMMVIINPEKQKEFSVLSIDISIERTLVIIPMFILLFTLFRRFLIINAAYILKKEIEKNIKTYKDFVISYPFPEFLRWKSESNFDLAISTIFQAVTDVLPGIAITVYPYILLVSGYGIEKYLTILLSVLGILTGILGIKNYSLLRGRIYVPLVGPINTTD